MEAFTNDFAGLKVSIAEGECQLARQRRIRPWIAGLLKRGKRVVRVKYGVDEDVCNGDHACIRLSGCPTLTLKDNPDPLKVDPVAPVIDGCVGCGRCGGHAHAAPPAPSLSRAERNGSGGKAALWWNDSYHENRRCFTRRIPQRDGGTHLAGVRGALTRQVTSNAEGMAKKEKITLTGDDGREGLTAVLAVKVPDPKFSSQTKDKLVNTEIEGVVSSIVYEGLMQFFDENPGRAKRVIEKSVNAARAREAARKARQPDRKSAPPAAALPRDPPARPVRSLHHAPAVHTHRRKHPVAQSLRKLGGCRDHE